jgi:hypothetical protein
VSQLRRRLPEAWPQPQRYSALPLSNVP